MRKGNDNLLLSLLIPVYKGEETIKENLLQIVDALDNIRYNYEAIVIIDGIVDNSLDIVKKINLPNVKYYAYKENHGKAYAIRLGMHKAKGDYIMFIDSGMEIDPNSISMLLEHMEWYDADIIVGSKRHPASVVKYSSSRVVLSQGYYWLVKILFGVTVRDTQAGIKVFKKSVLKKVLPRLFEKKFAGDLEMLVVAKLLGFNRIYEAPIKLDYTLAKVTSAATMTAIIRIFVDTLAIFYRKNIIRAYSRHTSKFSYPEKLISSQKE